MANYILKRLLLIIPTVIIVSMIIFLLVRFVPGSAVDVLESKVAASGGSLDRDAIEHELGLDVPIHKQYIIWSSGIIKGDMGNSIIQNRPVKDIISERLPVSIELAILSLLLSTVIAIPIGIISAIRHDRAADYSLRSLAVLMISVPNFWIATMIMIYGAILFGWSSNIKLIHFMTDPVANLKMFLLPAFINCLVQIGQTSRMLRTTLLEVLRKDFIRTAWAKGLNERMVVIGHALKNSLIPVITIIGQSISITLGGAVIIETIFNLPGLGSTIVFSLTQRDYPVVSGGVLVLSLFVLLVNLIVDISYKWLNPKIRYE